MTDLRREEIRLKPDSTVRNIRQKPDSTGRNIRLKPHSGSIRLKPDSAGTQRSPGFSKWSPASAGFTRRRSVRRVSEQTPWFHSAVGLLLAWGVLAFGSVYSWAFWPLALAAAVCGAAGVTTKMRAATGLPRLLGAPFVACLLLVALAAAIQLAPVPRDVAARLSPQASGVLSQLDLSFAAGLTPRHALSIAPAATLTALALYVAFATLLVGVARVTSSIGARRLASIICVLGVVVAVVGIVQRPLYAGKIYGIWSPETVNTRPFGPFVNPNHFAGWMLMALPLSFGLLCAAIARGMRDVKPGWRHRMIWLSSPDASHVILVGAAAVAMAVALVLTMSRSGMLAFGISLAVTTWFALRQLQAGSKQIIAAAYLACILAITVGCVGGDAIVARFASANPHNLNERLPIWSDTWRIVRDFWLTGTGLNTYGVATLVYQTVMPEFHLREAHNDYLQLLAEGGLLLSLPVLGLIAAFAMQVRRQFRQSRGSSYWLRLGAATGIVAIAVQSLVDFSLQMPGNAALFAVLCGIALHRPPAARSASSAGGLQSG